MRSDSRIEMALRVRKRGLESGREVYIVSRVRLAGVKMRQEMG